MSKWYEKTLEEKSNIIYSRIRLARNWDEYVFPSRLDEAGSRKLVDGLRDGLNDLGEKTGRKLSYRPLETMGQMEKKALREQSSYKGKGRSETRLRCHTRIRAIRQAANH